MNNEGNWETRLRASLAAVVLVVVSILVFSNSLENGFHLDDFGRIVNNPEINRVFPITRHFFDPSTSSVVPTTVQFRPLLPLTLSIDRALSRWTGADFLHLLHVNNLLLHLITSLLVFALFRLLAQMAAPKASAAGTSSVLIPFFAALIFAIHPVSGVPVNYLCSRDLLLMQLFLMGSFLCYVRLRIRGGRNPVYWTISILLLALSLLSKQNAVIAPVLVLLFELVMMRESARDWKVWTRVLPFGIVAAAFFIYSKVVIAFSDLGQLMVDRPFWEYPLTELRLHLFHYFRNFVWPFEMRPLPLLVPVASVLDWQMWLGALVILASLVAAWKAWPKERILTFAILGYWVLLAPTSSVLPFRLLATDYRQYPGLPFLSVCVVLALYRLLNRRVATGTALALATYFAIAAFSLNQVWKTEESLWAQSVRYGADSVGHHNYAMALLGKDDEKAEEHFREAIRITPNNVRSYVSLGLLLIRQGKVEEGLGLMEKAVRMAPQWGLTHYWYARSLSQLGRQKEAAASSRRAAELEPGNPTWLYQAAYDAQAVGDFDSSLHFLELLEAKSPGYRDAGFLCGFALQKLGDQERAIEHYLAFLTNNPSHVQATFNLAYALRKAGRREEAVQYFERVLELDPAYGAAHYHLAILFDELGKSDQAEIHRQEYRGGEPR